MFTLTALIVAVALTPIALLVISDIAVWLVEKFKQRP